MQLWEGFFSPKLLIFLSSRVFLTHTRPISLFSADLKVSILIWTLLWYLLRLRVKQIKKCKNDASAEWNQPDSHSSQKKAGGRKKENKQELTDLTNCPLQFCLHKFCSNRMDKCIKYQYVDRRCSINIH